MQIKHINSYIVFLALSLALATLISGVAIYGPWNQAGLSVIFAALTPQRCKFLFWNRFAGLFLPRLLIQFVLNGECISHSFLSPTSHFHIASCHWMYRFYIKPGWIYFGTWYDPSSGFSSKAYTGPFPSPQPPNCMWLINNKIVNMLIF